MKKALTLSRPILMTTTFFAVFTFFFIFSEGLFLKANAEISDTGPAGCAVWNALNSSEETFYLGFGVPWDVLDLQSQLFMKVACTTRGINLSVGGNEKDRYVWQYAYISSAGSPWARVSFEGGKNMGGWYRGGAYAFIPESKVVSGETNYLLSYVCTNTSGGWKCGCRSEKTCDASGLWQLQEVSYHPSSGEGFSITQGLGQIAFQKPTIFYPSKYEVSRGGTVTIWGGGFHSGQEVVFEGHGSISASMNQTGTSLTLAVPSDISYGRYDIWVEGGGQKSNETFLVVKGPSVESPKVISVSPTRLSFGEEATIRGTGFLENGNAVRTNLGVVKNISSVSGDTLTFSLPGGPGSGKIPPPVKALMEKYDLSRSEFIELQKEAMRTGPTKTMKGALRVVNGHGVSDQIEFIIEL